MSNLNEKNAAGATIVIVGNATREAEDKFDGKQTELRVAVARNYQKDGEWKSTPTVYYTVIASGDHAGALRQVGKGDKIRVDDAQYEPREYDKKDGTKGISHELRFGTVTVLKKAGQSQEQPSASADAPW